MAGRPRAARQPAGGRLGEDWGAWLYHALLLPGMAWGWWQQHRASVAAAEQHPDGGPGGWPRDRNAAPVLGEHPDR